MIMTSFAVSYVYVLRITLSSLTIYLFFLLKKMTLSEKEKVLVNCTLSLTPIRNAIKFENCECAKSQFEEKKIKLRVCKIIVNNEFFLIV